MVKYLYATAALVLSAAIPTTNAETFLSAGLTHQHQDYREFSNSGQLLDRDKGNLFGPQLRIGWLTEKQRFTLSHQNIQGTLSYDSISAKSHVDAKERNTALDVQHRLARYGKQSYHLTAGLSVTKRQRNIAGTASLSGLDETYNYKYGSIGAKLQYDISSQSRLSIATRYQQSFDADIEVSFVSQVFDPIDFPLAKRSGYDLQLELEQQLTNEWQLRINLSTSMTESNRSGSISLRKNAVLTNNSVSEPASESRHLSAFINIERYF